MVVCSIFFYLFEVLTVTLTVLIVTLTVRALL